MDWIESESFGLFCPCLADGFIGREALERLQPAGKIIGGDKVFEMSRQLRMVVIMIAFDGRFLDRAVHSLDLTVGPGMFGLVNRWSTSFCAQASSNACARKGCFFSIMT